MFQDFVVNNQIDENAKQIKVEKKYAQ